MACNKLKRTIRAGHICINTHNTTRIRAFVSGTPQAWSRSGKGAWFFFRTKAEVRPCPLGRLLETGGGLVYSVRLSERRPLTTSRQLVGAPSLRRPPPPPPIYRSRSSFFSFSSRRRTTLVDDADSRPRHLRHRFPFFFRTGSSRPPLWPCSNEGQDRLRVKRDIPTRTTFGGSRSLLWCS